ncbi:hypothetical protein SAMN06295937_10772 [Sphingopyxis flava]|uniref:Uncharacterized protein n=1 Tax=Sphingopyxis flava TaxID=1507287 RepID=A0A1T5GHD6_9SPHN|nr:hypothetical protein SAMN06295937_10772 [Sphingopyxis flava]
MSVHTYRAKVKLPNGSYQVVTVQADSTSNAKSMLEAQYGKGSVTSSPNRV